MPHDTYSAIGTVQGGSLSLRTPDAFKEALRHFPDGEVVVSIDEVTAKKRTLAQNSYMWLLVTAMAKETGQDKEEIHNYLRARFLTVPAMIVTADGEILEEREVVRSTTDLSPKEFSDYVDRCALFAAEELGFVLPERKESAA